MIDCWRAVFGVARQGLWASAARRGKCFFLARACSRGPHLIAHRPHLIARAAPDRTAHGDGRRLMGTKRLIYRRAVFISIDKGLQRKICTGKLF